MLGNCERCGKVVKGKILKVSGGFYHPDCFTCVVRLTFSGGFGIYVSCRFAWRAWLVFHFHWMMINWFTALRIIRSKTLITRIGHYAPTKKRKVLGFK
jgi:hypothetical protein